MNQPVPHEAATETAADTSAAPAPLAVEALVEEVSIDGMCGVY